MVADRKGVAYATLIRILTEKKDDFTRLGDSLVYKSSANRFVKQKIAEGDKSAIKLALCLTQREDSILLSCVVLDKRGEWVLVPGDHDYNTVKRLFDED